VAILQTCRRHPKAGRFMATCPGCAQDLYDIEQANRARADAELSAKVRTALGLPGHGKPIREAGETAVRVCMWDQVELSAVYERVGGTVTSRTVQRTGSCSTWSATEITVTVELPGVGVVEVFTDWDEETGGDDIPLAHALRQPAAA
jgi:hypothetical protein